MSYTYLLSVDNPNINFKETRCKSYVLNVPNVLVLLLFIVTVLVLAAVAAAAPAAAAVAAAIVIVILLRAKGVKTAIYKVAVATVPS